MASGPWPAIAYAAGRMHFPNLHLAVCRESERKRTIPSSAQVCGKPFPSFAECTTQAQCRCFLQ